MIRAIRPSAMAQDDASLVAGWNVSPNVGYTVVLTPGPSACGVLLFDADMTTAIASGAGLVGTAQPVVLLPQTGQTIGMVDADLGWHLLLTTTGAEAQQTIRIGPAVDLPDEIHPIYTDDNMALARATASINSGASYVDDVTVTCPIGLGASIGDTASVPVDGVAVVGQVESVTWTATPDGATTQAVIRRHSAIAPEATIAPPTPPSVIDDAAETDAATEASGNVLTNDDEGLTVVAVEGLGSKVGVVVAGSNGGEFTIAADGAWTFDPSGDFSALTGTDTATTSVAYHASDGVSEASATLTVTVASVETDPYWGNVVLLIQPQDDAVDGSSAIADISLAARTVSRYGNAQIDTSQGYPAIHLDGSGDYCTVPNDSIFNFTSTCTLEVLFRPLSMSSDFRTLVAKRANNTSAKAIGWALAVRGAPFATPNTIEFIGWSSGAVVTRITGPSNLIAANADYHVEVARDSSGVYRMYVDGVYIGSSANTMQVTAEALHIGRYSTTVSGLNPAYDAHALMRVRWTDGVARHTSASPFTPPAKF